MCEAIGPDLALVASCLGESTGGGLIYFDGKDVNVLDTISSTGLAYANGHLMRLIWCRGDFAAPGELVVSDATGVERYHRLDSLSDPHDIRFDGQHYVVVSSGTNAILWISRGGDVVRRSVMPGHADSWHLNSLCFHNDDLYVTAFGRFDHYREWHQYAGHRRGIVFNHRTGMDVLSGLEMPHHARFENGSWIVCNSGARQLLQFSDGAAEPVRTITLDKWTRGLAVSDKYLFVGESARRYRTAGDTGDALASIAILRRDTWQLVDRIPLPFEEVYDLILIPAVLVNGIRRGFRTNPQRVQEQNQHCLFEQLGIKPPLLWASGDLLPREACAAKIALCVEPQLDPDCFLELTCVVENCGTCIFVSVKPHPVLIAYRWFSKEAGRFVWNHSIGTRLPTSIPPGDSLECKVKLQTPKVPGHYELHVSLFQKGNGFFEDLGISSAFKAPVLIEKQPNAAEAQTGQEFTEYGDDVYR
jgi:acetolactate synthase-1/2/3 large subunit